MGALHSTLVARNSEKVRYTVRNYKNLQQDSHLNLSVRLCIYMGTQPIADCCTEFCTHSVSVWAVDGIPNNCGAVIHYVAFAVAHQRHE